MGNDVSIKNLAITREEVSNASLVLLNSDGTHNANYLFLGGILFDCKTANATNGLIRSLGTGAGTRILNCVIKTDGATNFIVKNSVGSISGIVDDCIAIGGAVSVPATMTLGTNINITATEATTTGEEV